jgi:hypothetical protein
MTQNITDGGEAYPRIYDRNIPAQQWQADYVATYVQRDVRQVLNVGNLGRFTTFLRLCAASTARKLNGGSEAVVRSGVQVMRWNAL